MRAGLFRVFYKTGFKESQIADQQESLQGVTRITAKT
jgi:hypothetical protein